MVKLIAIIKKHKLIFLFLLVLFFNLGSRLALALEISDYPHIPGLKTPTDNDLPILIAYWFGFGCYIAGAIAAISFAIGAVQLAVSGNSPTVQKDAKDRMKASILGMILTVSAVVILQTINPSIATVTITPLAETDGIYYTDGKNYIAAPSSESNTNNITAGYKTLIYKCTAGTPILIWEYPKTNFEGNDDNYGGVKVVRKTCGQSESLGSIKSFKWEYETSGIYYCMGGCSETGTICSGYMSQANLSSETLSSPFKDNLSSVRIVNDIAKDLHYGVIFHGVEDPTAAGSCLPPIYSTDTKKEVECFDSIVPSTSATVYYWNDKDYEKSGTGVTFYSEPFGWMSGARAGKYFLTAKAIEKRWHLYAGSILFNFTGVERPAKYKTIYPNFEIKGGSIKMDGNYLLILWHGGSYCQVFFKNIYNLKSTEIYASLGGANVVTVIPIK